MRADEDPREETAPETVETIWSGLREAIRRFVGDAPPFDDLTLMLLERRAR